jgi:isoleucyl-tRNA synthetase
MLAPILVHTAEEALAAMKFKSQQAGSIHLTTMPEVDRTIDWQHEQGKWQKVMGLRDEVLRVLEGLRNDKKITSNQQASVEIGCGDKELTGLLNELGLAQFAALCIVSEVKLQESRGETTIVAQKSVHQKCQRCWNYWQSVGTNGQYPDLCKRCVDVVSSIKK